jgi:hypothetical protein
MNGEPEASGEESLDVEAAHAMAPDASISYVGANCSDTDPGVFLGAESRIVDKQPRRYRQQLLDPRHGGYGNA